MAGRWIEVKAKDGGSFKAYLATPEKGSGPGIVLLQEIFGVNAYIRSVADHYAEEGYVVLAPDLFWRIEPGIELGFTEEDRKQAFAYREKFDVDRSVEDIGATIAALRARPEMKGKVGAIGFCLGGLLAYLSAARLGVDCAVSYYGVGIEQVLGEAAKIKCPMVLHMGEKDRWTPPAVVSAIKAAFEGRPDIEIYVYPGVDHAFSRKGGSNFDKPAAMMAHSRSIAVFRKVLGPVFNLSTLWEQHCYYEFATRDVDATMTTMVAEPYVNHVPTMTGGVGAKDLSRFYKNHFVNSNPADTRLIPISRTVGADRVVDEMIFCFTHDREIAGGDRQFPRRQALSRAHLLGSGLGAGADRPARPQARARRRRGDGEEGARRDTALQHADEALGRKRQGEVERGRVYSRTTYWRFPATV
jgi:carboxymethylenebutenolidase